MDWFERVPKVELHVHLEGAVPLPALWELLRKYGGDPSVPDPEALARRFRFRDFQQFVEVFQWLVRWFREYEDFTHVAEAVARDLARQNIRYVEMHYAPPIFARFGLGVAEITEAVRAGLGRVPGVEVGLVADLVRDLGPAKGAATLAALGEAKELGVVGIGIGGSEHAFPPEPFEKVYEEARRLGLRTTAHAGEGAGPESIWGAIRTLRVDRIGHGTRAEEDESLLDHLVERRIPVEMCPLSNVRTGVVKSYDQHPVRRYRDRGILVSVSTDDPSMFGNSLAEELRLLESTFGFSRDEVREMILMGIDASWLSAARKRELAETFRRDPAWNEGRGERG